MPRTRLNAAQRERALAEMADEPVDLLVIGGGVTGAGIALDAATRGLRVAVVEMQDWAGGTSQWSSKLVHGGLRYLYQFNFTLVAEALRERGLLLTRTAPHLVKAQPFLWPLKTPLVERSYSAVGVGMYDMLGQFGGGGHNAVPNQRHYTKEGALELFPGIREDALIGAIRFYDARVDDARLVIDLVRSAVGYGALCASRAQVVGYLTEPSGSSAVPEGGEQGNRIERSGWRAPRWMTDIRGSRDQAPQVPAAGEPADTTGDGPGAPDTPEVPEASDPPADAPAPPAERVAGAIVRDLETGQDVRVRARYVVTATGVWTEHTQTLATDAGPLKVLASKGIHLVVPKEAIDGRTGIFLRTETSVLFIIPWDRYWVIGTTDTEWSEDLVHPVTTSADVDYVLEQANNVLARPLSRDDVIGTYAGLRPLLQPKRAEKDGSAKVSREHTVAEVRSGLAAIAGGKLTTYRVMAEDAVDFVLDRLEGKGAARRRPSITDRVPLVGAAGYPAWQAQCERIAADEGWTAERVQHLLDRYGDELPVILDMVGDDPDLGRPLAHAEAYMRAEVVFAVTHEGALHLEDIVRKRVRLDHEQRDRGLAALPEIGEIVAPLLGWDEARLAEEIESYRQRVEAEAAAERESDDATAVRARQSAADLVPLVVSGDVDPHEPADPLPEDAIPDDRDGEPGEPGDPDEVEAR